MLRDHGWLTPTTNIIEPCVGDGALLKNLGSTDFASITASDIEPRWDGAERLDFFAAPTPQDKFDLVLTNPPFGRCSALASQCLNHAINFSDRLAFILPATFMRAPLLDRVHRNLWPVFAERLPDTHFVMPNGKKRTRIGACFELWERREAVRPLFAELVEGHKWFERVPFDQADFAFRQAGQSAGRVLPSLTNNQGQPHGKTTTAFLVGDRQRIEAHDWTPLAKHATSVFSMGLLDLAVGLHVEEQGGDVTSYIQGGAVSLLVSPTFPLQVQASGKAHRRRSLLR